VSSFLTASAHIRLFGAINGVKRRYNVKGHNYQCVVVKQGDIVVRILSY